MKKIILIAMLGLLVVMAACSTTKSSSINGMGHSMNSMEHGQMIRQENTKTNSNSEFEKLCKDRTPDNWMTMRPMKNGAFTAVESCWGCMSDDGMEHFCSVEEYNEYLENEN